MILETKQQSTKHYFLDHDKWRYIIVNINTTHFPHASVARISDYFQLKSKHIYPMSTGMLTKRVKSLLLLDMLHCNISRRRISSQVFFSFLTKNAALLCQKHSPWHCTDEKDKTIGIQNQSVQISPDHIIDIIGSLQLINSNSQMRINFCYKHQGFVYTKVSFRAAYHV